MPYVDHEKMEFPEDLLDRLCGETGERRWWAVYTKARQEKALSRQLFSHEIPHYLPLVAQESMVRGRRVRCQSPVFSGYLFLFGSQEERVTALTTNRISQIFPVGSEFELGSELRRLRDLISLGAPLTAESRLEPGTMVRVKSGALMGLEGNIIRRKNSCRLVVGVSYLQQGVSIEIDDFMVEAI